MKLLIISFLLTISLTSFAQYKVNGRYRDYFGNRIQLNADKTFKYTWNFDMAASWTKGTWVLQSDTVYFQMVPTYDTLSKINLNGSSSDTLILSDDEISSRISGTQYLGNALSSGGQNRMTYPEKLVIREGRLYKVQNEKLVVNKKKGFWTGKMCDPWFFKSDD